MRVRTSSSPVAIDRQTDRQTDRLIDTIRYDTIRYDTMQRGARLSRLTSQQPARSTHLLAAGSNTKWATIDTMMAAESEISKRTQVSSSADLQARGDCVHCAQAGGRITAAEGIGAMPVLISESTEERPKNAVMSDQLQTVKVAKRSGP